MILDKDYVKCLKEDLHGTLNRLDLDHANFKAQNPCQPIIVFHCEFSQRRGPRAFRALRNMDRTFNKWPALNYPEIYILEGGYEKFHAEYPVSNFLS
jgi:Mitotic inducer, protein phosphatase